MNLHNLSSTYRIFLIAIGLIGALPAQAAVTYEYRGRPIFVGEADTGAGSYVQTTPGLLKDSFFPPAPPISIGSPIPATFSFASPLAPSSTIPFHLESGGFNFLGPTTGGLQAYSTGILKSVAEYGRITSDINTYLVGSPVNNFYEYYRYSALDGHVTTDASGNISAWDLTFTLYDDPNGGILIDKNTNPPTAHSWAGGSFAFQPDAVLHISSDPASFHQITNVVSLNQMPHTGPYDFFGADWAQENPGANLHYRYYTEQPGSIVLVPEPESWAMMMAGLGFLGWRIRRLKK
jgi:hypothetical protein